MTRDLMRRLDRMRNNIPLIYEPMTTGDKELLGVEARETMKQWREWYFDVEDGDLFVPNEDFVFSMLLDSFSEFGRGDICSVFPGYLAAFRIISTPPGHDVDEELWEELLDAYVQGPVYVPDRHQERTDLVMRGHWSSVVLLIVVLHADDAIPVRSGYEEWINIKMQGQNGKEPDRHSHRFALGSELLDLVRQNDPSWNPLEFLGPRPRRVKRTYEVVDETVPDDEIIS